MSSLGRYTPAERSLFEEFVEFVSKSYFPDLGDNFLKLALATASISRIAEGKARVYISDDQSTVLYDGEESLVHTTGNYLGDYVSFPVFISNGRRLIGF